MNKRIHHRLTRRGLLKTLPAAAAMLHPAARAQGGGVRVLIGTGGHGSEGIYAATLKDGVLSTPALVARVANPSFLALPQPGGPFLFAVTQPEERNSNASSFRWAGSGMFAPVGEAASGSPGGCHCAATKDGRCVFVANYGGGSVASFLADANGGLTLATLQKYGPEGHGPVKDRQEASHVHSAQAAPGEQFVLVSDLGLDRIHILRLDRATAKMTPHGEFLARPGAGPRHMVAHSNGRWIYSINELNSSIDVLDWDGVKGTLTLRTIVNTLPHQVDPVDKRACELVFAPGERFLYASNRIYEDFAVFAVNPDTGTLTNVQHLPNPGKESRHIAISPDGRSFLSANQFSDDISVWALDPATGRLGAKTSQVKVGAPSCLVFG